MQTIIWSTNLGDVIRQQVKGMHASALKERFSNPKFLSSLPLSVYEREALSNDINNSKPSDKHQAMGWM